MVGMDVNRHRNRTRNYYCTLHSWKSSAEKKQAAQKEAMLEAAQPVTMLVIDKKNAAYERRQSSKNR